MNNQFEVDQLCRMLGMNVEQSKFETAIYKAVTDNNQRIAALESTVAELVSHKPHSMSEADVYKAMIETDAYIMPKRELKPLSEDALNAYEWTFNPKKAKALIEEDAKPAEQVKPRARRSAGKEVTLIFNSLSEANAYREANPLYRTGY